MGPSHSWGYNMGSGGRLVPRDAIWRVKLEFHAHLTERLTGAGPWGCRR